MRAHTVLPENYSQIYSINLQNDKKLAFLVNFAAVILAAVLVAPMVFIVPISTLFDMSKGLLSYFLRFAILLVGMVVYMVLHELVHGVAMKFFGTKKVKYGFTGLYAFAGSDDYYDKTSYIIIALAPIIVLGVIIAIINAFVPLSYFWVVYLIQIINISGAAGDLFVTFRFLKMPKDILIKDHGVGMVVYSAQQI